MQIVFAILAGIAGMLAGGVINALADDLPARRTLQLPHYPDDSPRPPSAWLGITAFLTGQRASPTASQERLSWRHPIVEIVMTVAYITLTIGYWGDARLWAYFGYVAILLLITVIDMEHRLILFVVIVPSTLFALVMAFLTPESQFEFTDYLLGAALGFGMFYLLYLGGAVYVRLRGLNVVAFGFGDVMLAGLCGLILSWEPFIFASVLTILAGAAGSLLYMLVSMVVSRRAGWLKPLPYGPYIVFGTLMLLFAREEVKEILIRGAY